MGKISLIEKPRKLLSGNVLLIDIAKEKELNTQEKKQSFCKQLKSYNRKKFFFSASDKT